MCIYGSILFIILKELKYATHKSSTVSFLEMSCRLHVACDEMRKRHFVQKPWKKANCYASVGAKVNIPNTVRAW